jgi:hypothetical protein
MTGPEHYREAESLIDSAGAVMDADYGWMASLSSQERLHHRQAYLADAQVHATLALAAATALGRESAARQMPSPDRAAWFDAASECRKAAQA